MSGKNKICPMNDLNIEQSKMQPDFEFQNNLKIENPLHLMFSESQGHGMRRKGKFQYTIWLRSEQRYNNTITVWCF